MRLLLIEDDKPTRFAVAELLAEEGIEVDALAYAEDALVLLGAGQVPDVLVTDIDLGPGLSGTDLAEIARARYPSVELVFIGGARPGPAAAGKNHFVQKPFTIAELVGVIHEATGQAPGRPPEQVATG